MAEGRKLPPENRSKITPIGRNHADYYVVIVVKNFNSKSVVLNGINKKKIEKNAHPRVSVENKIEII